MVLDFNVEEVFNGYKFSDFCLFKYEDYAWFWNDDRYLKPFNR